MNLQATGPLHLSRKYSSSSSWLMSQGRCWIFSLVLVFWLLSFSVFFDYSALAWVPPFPNEPARLVLKGKSIGLSLEDIQYQSSCPLPGKGSCWASSMAQQVKNPPAMQETWVRSLGQEDPLEEEMATHSSVLAWKKSHGQRILAGYSPWGHKGSNMTEHACMQGSSLLSLGPQSNRTSLTENNTISLYALVALEKFFIFTIMKFAWSTEGLWSLPLGWWWYSLLSFLVVLALKIMNHSRHFFVSLWSRLWM